MRRLQCQTLQSCLLTHTAGGKGNCQTGAIKEDPEREQIGGKRVWRDKKKAEKHQSETYPLEADNFRQ